MKLFLSIAFICTFSISGYAGNQAYEMRSSPALQFLMHLFDTMKKVSPEQNESYQNYEKDLLTLLKKARKLDLAYHQQKGRGLKGKGERRKMIEEGKSVLNEALDKTDKFLEDLQKAIKSERKKIILELYPQLNDE